MRNKSAKVSDPNVFISCPGSRIHVLFSSSIEPDGSFVLVKTGEEDIQDLIDSYRSSCDMTYILKQLALGNTAVLSQKEPMYGDFTEMPKSYAEALQVVMDAEQKFSKLPLDVRNAFDNDFKKWFASSGSEDWFKKMDSVLVHEQVEDDVSEVNSDES